MYVGRQTDTIFIENQNEYKISEKLYPVYNNMLIIYVTHMEPLLYCIINSNIKMRMWSVWYFQ